MVGWIRSRVMIFQQIGNISHDLFVVAGDGDRAPCCAEERISRGLLPLTFWRFRPKGKPARQNFHGVRDQKRTA